MKIEHKVIVISVGLGLLFWVIDAAVDHFYFYSGSFWDSLVLDISPVELYMRTLTICFFLAFGFLLSINLAGHARVQRALQESESRYRSLFMKNSSVMLLIDPQNDEIVEANPAACSFYGWNEEELTGKKITEINTLPRERIFQEIERARSAERQHFLFRHRLANGDIRDVEVYTGPITLQGRRLLYSIIHDITERKRAEQALQMSERELRLLSSQLLFAQEKERGRIARELHDSVGQSLSAITFLVEGTLHRVGKAKTETAIKSFELLIPAIQNAVKEVRRICKDLRPPSLDDLGILETIGLFCLDFQKVFPDVQIKSEIHLEENGIPESLKIVFYRVLQEAMNNIAKHSKAESVVITLKEENRTLELIVEDNGIGFDLEKAVSVENPRRGFGLASMRERTELSGGFLAIETRKGEGTLIRASWPVETPKPV